ncbi:GFA family protein [Roseibium sp. RKSG952]|uniref:GFA family protein n=1 Tax=Roseibium sp. RKSG952 TaxID=2529384 RepID=UPI0012BC12F8|nr:GFA family protein [Roseibium sp. RKSG952]MTI00344.1 GFA family protein [Roseibium sp. RKSG952]
MDRKVLSGGCQCGAVRYKLSGLGRAAICYCRMCQKAIGSFITAQARYEEIEWTRGTPAYFWSSNKVKRGFCRECGTSLTYDHFDKRLIVIASLDNPELAPPTIQAGTEGRLSWCPELPGIPACTTDEDVLADKYYEGLISYQHPDHDTEIWPPAEFTPDRKE